MEIGFEISACANSVYQAILLPLLKRLGTRLVTIMLSHVATNKGLYRKLRTEAVLITFLGLLSVQMNILHTLIPSGL